MQVLVLLRIDGGCCSHLLFILAVRFNLGLSLQVLIVVILSLVLLIGLASGDLVLNDNNVGCSHDL